jgi:tetratricopeptide (TPR) repeat protein
MDADRTRKMGTDCWKRGNDAAVKQDWDYAIQMYGQAVGFVAENLAFRQTLRGSEQKKYGDNKTGARMSKMKLLPIRARIKKAAGKADWDAVDKAAEEGLAINPWDSGINASLGEACRQRGYIDVAVFCYQAAAAGEPDKKHHWQTLAKLEEERGNYTQASSCWQRIRKIDPLDADARSSLSALDAKQVMDRGGYEKADSTREMKSAYDADRPNKAAAHESVETPGENVEADLQRNIRRDPSDSASHLKLADLYKREGRLEDALETYNKALEVSGGDASIRELVEDVQLDLLKDNLLKAKEAAAADAKNTQARKNAKKLAVELIQREIEVLSSRVDRYPADVKMKFELAQRFMRVQKYPQAIPLLQRAVADARIEADVLVALGKCFIAEKKNTIALRNLAKAVELIDPGTQPKQAAEVHYLLGRLYEEAKEAEKAEDHYNEVLLIDYEYRDALARLEKMQGG